MVIISGVPIFRIFTVLKMRWTYCKQNCCASILLGMFYDMMQSGINCSESSDSCISDLEAEVSDGSGVTVLSIS